MKMKDVVIKVLCLAMALVLLVSTADAVAAEAFNGWLSSAVAEDYDEWVDDFDWDFEVAESIGEPVVHMHIGFSEDFDALVDTFDSLDDSDIFTIPGAIPVPPGEWWEDDHWDEIVYGEPLEEETFTPFDLDLTIDHIVDFQDMQAMTNEEMLEAELIYDILWGELSQHDDFIEGFWGFPVYGELIYDENFTLFDPEDAVDINDLPWGNPGDWLEDGEYPAVMPRVVLPSLRVATGGLTSRSVTLTGTITSSGSAPVQTREFWIRRDGQANHQVYTPTTVSGTTFSRTITGLLPGTTYHVRAVGRYGGSSQSGQSDAVTFRTPFEAPSAPQNFRVTPGNGSATLSWALPVSNGGASLTHFQVSSNGGSTWTTANSLVGHTFSNLQPGTYTFRVRAVNSAGLLGAQVQATITITRITLPTVSGFVVNSPTSPASTSVTLSGTVQNNGGAAIIEHGFWIRPVNSTQMQREERRGSATTFSWTIWGLQPNTEYVARAIAVNSGIAGAGQSNEIRFRTAAAAASAPVPFTVATNNSTGNITLNWAAPANTGGGSIIRYEVTVNNGAPIHLPSTARSHTVTNLQTGTYTFRIRAVTSANSAEILGLQSQATATITRVSLPIVQSNWIVDAPGTDRVTLSGTILNDGGANITSRGFFIRRADGIGGEWEVPADRIIGSVFEATIRGLTPGTDYIARAIARNSGSQSAGQGGVISFRTDTLPTLSLSEHSRTITAALQDIIVDVRSNRTWSVSVAPEAQGWLRVSRRTPSHIAGNGDFTLHADPNMSTTQRIGRVTVTAENLTVHFDVVQRPWVVVMLDANGGTVVNDVLRLPNSIASDLLPIPDRPGYVFVGWFNARNEYVFPNTSLNNGETLIARWQINITLDPAGGSVNTTSIIARDGRPVGLLLLHGLPIPTRDGYEFLGWFNIFGYRITEESNTINVHFSLTARWQSLIDGAYIWHSYPHDDRVGFWSGDVSIYTQLLGPVSPEFRLDDRMAAASIAWMDALGIQLTQASSEFTAQIRVLGGARQQVAIDLHGPDAFPEQIWWQGLADLTSASTPPAGTITVNNATKRVLSIWGHAIVHIVQRSDDLVWTPQTRNEMDYVIVHELGHALGWFGHSSIAADVMYGVVHEGYAIQDREARHLRQIYDRFR